MSDHPDPQPPLQHLLEGHLRQVVGDRSPYLASANHFFVRQYIQRNCSTGLTGTDE